MKPKRQARGKIYASILRYFLLTTTLLTLGASVALYVSYERFALRQAYTTNLELLGKNKNQIPNMRALARTLASQIYFDTNVAYLLYGRDFDPYRLRAAMVQLDNYRLTVPFVESVYVYNGATESLSVSSGTYGGFGIPLTDGKAFYFDPELPRIIERIADYDPLTPLSRRVRLESVSGTETKFYYTFVFKEILPSSKVNSTILVNFSDRWLDRMIADGNASSETLIVDGKGIVASNSADWTMGEDLSRESFYAGLTPGGDGTGHVIATVRGVKSLVTFILGDSMDWRYIKITGHAAITAGIRKIRWMTIAFDLLFIALSAATSLIVSRRLYGPIGRVQENLRVLEEENKGIRKIGEREALRELLASRASGDTRTPIPVLFAGSQVDAVRLVIVRIDGMKRFVENFGREERHELRDSAMELAAAVFNGKRTVRCVDMGESGNLCLVVTEDDGSGHLEDEAWTLSRAEEAKKAIASELGLSVSLIISETETGFSGLPLLYERTAEAAFHRIFRGYGSVVLAREIAEKYGNYYDYPAKREEAFVSAVMEGKAERAREIMDEILVDSSGYSFAVFSGCVSRLVITISNIVNSVRKNNLLQIPDETLAKVVSPINPYDADSMDEIRSFLSDIVSEVVSRIGDKRGARHDELLAQVEAIIRSRYPDPGLCLEGIATETGMSSAYLGRIYKHHTLKSVAERIVEVRIAEAKRLLIEERKLTVAEITVKVGFTSGSYFSKLFRKETAITPNEYRRTARCE